MWVEHWPWPTERQVDPPAIAQRVADILAKRQIAVCPVAIRGDDDRTTGAWIEMIERYAHIYIGAGGIELQMVAMRDDEGHPGYIGFSRDDHPRPWEPPYRLFAEIARALGGEQDPPIDEAIDPTQLHGELRDVVDAIAGDELDDPGEATLEVLGTAALDAFELNVATDPRGLVVQVTGAGERIVLRVVCDARQLTGPRLEKVSAMLREDIEAVVIDQAFGRWARVAPVPDPQRAGRCVLEILRGARVTDAVVVTELGDVDARREGRTVGVTQYFSDGTPFWRATLLAGEDTGDLADLEDLHHHRTWQWTP
jgi:hypothetical protein